MVVTSQNALNGELRRRQSPRIFLAGDQLIFAPLPLDKFDGEWRANMAFYTGVSRPFGTPHPS